jgi:uncharacterized cupredoxin-like copper-binding protein
MTTRLTRRHAGAAILPALLILAACSSSASPSGSTAPDESAGADGTTVEVTLQEFAIVLGETSAPAGTVTFAVTNDGPDLIHEFVVIRTDLAAADLPVDDTTGAVDESGDGIEVVDELEDVEVGSTVELTVDLEAGAYVLICNIDEGTPDTSHYHNGMRAAFTVE